MKKVIHILNMLEGKTRFKLQHFPVLYTFIAGVSGIIFLRGIWEVLDALFGDVMILHPFVDGGISMILGVVIFLVSGFLVSFFMADHAPGAPTHWKHPHNDALSSKVDLLEAHVGYLDEKLAEMSKKLHND